jgi:hypothetical protein
MSQNREQQLQYHIERATAASRQLILIFGQTSEKWNRFAPFQQEFFRVKNEIADLYERNTGVIDFVIAVAIVFSVGIDFLFFHAPVDLFVEAVVDSAILKTLVTIAFLIAYIFFEIKACYGIHEAWEYAKNDPFNPLAQFKKWAFSIGGVAYACIPAGLFYYVMMVATTTSLPYFFILPLCLMSAVTHLWLIFGGKSTIRSLNRFFGGMRCNGLNRQRHKAFKHVRKAIDRAHFAGQNFDIHEKAYLALGGNQDYFPEKVESEFVSSVYAFIEGGYYQVDPDELPFEFSHLFGRTRLDGGDGNNRKILR